MYAAEHILVVDDEVTIRDLIRAVLGAAGFEVESVGSGEEALGRLRRESFDLVITDNAMQPMSGVELATAIKRRLPSLPVMMVSGSPPREPMSCLDMVLHKPEDLRTLPDSVKAVLARKTRL